MITPQTDKSASPKKLFIAAGIMILVAFTVTMLVIFLPEDEAQTSTKPLRLTFLKQGNAVILAPDGKQKAAFDIELADTPETQKNGLMYRDNMQDNQGMLFTYKTADQMNFWMKNTYLPLDIIFFLPDSTIYKVYPDNVPFTETSISPFEKCLYALEINAGLAKANNLQPGDKLNWKRLDN